MTVAKTMQRDMAPGPGVVYPDMQVGDYGVKPEEILIQIIRRPSDPIAERLQDCIAQWVSAGFAVQHIRDQFGGWIDITRNWQAQLFRKSAPQFKYALLIDTDVSPDNSALPVLLARHQLPVVSACVPAITHEKGLFLCLVVRDPDGTARWVSVKETKKIPATGIAEIDNCGTGCVMIRRDVIDKLWDLHEREMIATDSHRTALLSLVAGDPVTDEIRAAARGMLKKLSIKDDTSGAPFSIPVSIRDAAALTGAIAKGEDICFTDRVRAAGFKIYVDFEAHCYHEKVIMLQWPKDAIDPMLDAADWRMSAFAPALAKV